MLKSPLYLYCCFDLFMCLWMNEFVCLGVFFGGSTPASNKALFGKCGGVPVVCESLIQYMGERDAVINACWAIRNVTYQNGFFQQLLCCFGDC